MDNVCYLTVGMSHAIAWPEIYCAAVIGSFIIFVGVTLFVALFTPNIRRAERAQEMFRALLDFLRRRRR
jgi:hypothetical protein